MPNPPGDVLDGETGSCLNEATDKEARSRVTDVVGGHGPWQFRFWAVFFLATFCCSLHLFSTLPLVNVPSCTCSSAPENKNGSVSVPAICNISNCNTRTNEKRWRELSDPCFSPTAQSSFQISEELEDISECSNAGSVFYSKCLFFLGSLAAAFTTSPLTKRFGRRSVSLTFCFLLCACSFAGIWGFAPGPFLVLKWVLSTGLVSVYLTAATSLTDCLAEEFRLLYFYTAHISWGGAHFVLPLLVWTVPNWASYNLFLTAPCFLLLVVLCFLPETAESYASRGLVSRAHRVMRKAAKCNGFSLQGVEQFSPNLLLKEREIENSDLSLIWKGKKPRILLQHIGLFFVGFLSTLIYFSMMWVAEGLAVKRGPFFSLLGTSEVAAALVLLSLSYVVPVRRVYALTSCLSSVFLIIMYVKENKAKPKFSRGFHLVQMFFASASWTLVLLHVLSRSPNSNRTIATGICTGLLAAALADIQKFTSWNPVFLLMMGAPNLMLAVLSGFIPNTYLDGLNI